VNHPRALTLSQRIAISIRGQSSVKARLFDKQTGKTSTKPVSWSLVVPLCADCSPTMRKVLGCHRFAEMRPKVPHRITYTSDPKQATKISFCFRSYDDPSLDKEVVRVLNEIDKEGLYPFYGKPIQHLANRTVEVVQEVRAAWRNLLDERDAIEGGT